MVHLTTAVRRARAEPAGGTPTAKRAGGQAHSSQETKNSLAYVLYLDCRLCVLLGISIDIHSNSLSGVAVLEQQQYELGSNSRVDTDVRMLRGHEVIGETRHTVSSAENGVVESKYRVEE